MLIHTPNDPYRPSGKGGGSKRGKVQNKWPMFIKTCIHALGARAYGSEDGYLYKRGYPLSNEKLGEQLDQLLPGVWKWLGLYMKSTKSGLVKLARNRPYYMYHRQGQVRSPTVEYWSKHYPLNHPMHGLHSAIVRNQCTKIPNWLELMAEYDP